MRFSPVLGWLLTTPLVLVLLGLAALVALAPRGGRAGRTTGARRGGALALVSLALLFPGVGNGSAAAGQRELDVIFVVDTTSSAAARDYDGGKERLEGYRADTAAIAQELSGAKYALITFDSRGRLTMPLTDDAAALASAMEILDTESTFRAKGSSITVARDALRETLERAEEKDPGRAHVVFYLGDGEQTNGAAPEPLDVPKDLVDGGAVLGYGTADGGPMRRNDAFPGLEKDGEPTEDIQYRGQPARSSIDEGALRGVADQLGVPYVNRNSGGSIAPALEGVDRGGIAGTEGGVPVGFPLYWLLVLGALGLLAWDAAAIVRGLARLSAPTREGA